MSFPKILLICTVILFTVIAISATIKQIRKASSNEKITEKTDSPREEAPIKEPSPIKEVALVKNTQEIIPTLSPIPAPERTGFPLPEVDRMNEFFNKNDPKFPVVQTVIYKSRVPWQKGRPAWLSDYASHYSTSRHFIARSLNGKADYFKQDVSEGDRFNVFNLEKHITFYLLIDTSRCKMWLYYIDSDSHERVLVKTYNVGLGRIDPMKPSGLLTPLGSYTLGSKIAIYKPKVMGFYNGQKMEFIRIFGTRWIPFDKEINGCTAPAEGFGIHGLPWLPNEKGDLTEQVESLGKYESDGCVRLSTQDIEELFAVIITRKTVIELVKDFYEAQLPGIEH